MYAGRILDENRCPSRLSFTRGADSDRTGTGDNITSTGVPVRDDHPFAGRVDLIGVAIKIGLTLRQQRGREHLLRGHPAQLIKVDRGRLEPVDRLGVGLD